MSENISLVCLSSTRWDYIWQRPQQLMSRLADQISVLHIDHTYPVSLKEAFELIEDSQKLTHRLVKRGKNLYSFPLVEINSGELNRVLRQEAIYEFNNLIKAILINKILTELAISNPILWTCLPNSLPVVCQIPHRLLCYDCVDEFSSFSWWPDDIGLIETELIKSADMVFTTAQLLFERCSLFNEHTYLLPNAADIKHFSQLKPTKTAEYFDRPVIMYIGAVYEWIDTVLLLDIALSHPEWSLVLIGPIHGVNLNPFKLCPNVHFLGPREYDSLPGYLHLADVCIIPFLKNETTHHTNPIKMYEYLAAGKSVVTIDLPETKPFDDVVRLASNHREFIDQIEQALIENELAEPQKAALYKQRRKVAAANTWEHRCEMIKALFIKQLDKKRTTLV